MTFDNLFYFLFSSKHLITLYGVINYAEVWQLLFKTFFSAGEMAQWLDCCLLFQRKRTLGPFPAPTWQLLTVWNSSPR